LSRAFGQRDGACVRTALGCLAVLAWSLPTFAPGLAYAQSPRVGFLDGVRGVVSETDCGRDYALKASRGAIRLVRRNVELPVTPVDSAVVADRLRVGRQTDLRFRVDAQRFGVGTFFLSPEFGRCTQAANGLRAVGIELGSGEGSYELSSRTERSRGGQLERLVLSIENGAATVEWAKGALSVIALGREIRDSGTVFTVLVDSARNRALLYVRDGSVTMAGAAAMRATEGRAFVFGRTGPPQPVTLSTDVLSDITYHSRTVWVQRYKPGFPYWRVLGGTALGGSAAYIIWRQTRPSKSGPFDGTINVKLPL
jgi:hypothetical protein